MPPTLNYDTLPPGSDIRYELDANAIRIIIPASDIRITFPIDELPLHLRRTILRQSIAHPALFSAAVTALVLCAIQYMSLSSPDRLILTAAVVTFGLAGFALLLHVVYLARRDTLTTARRQFTLIDASPDQLLIESAGPFGAQSHNLDPHQIRAIKVARLPRRPRSNSPTPSPSSFPPRPSTSPPPASTPNSLGSRNPCAIESFAHPDN
jgi:hypothetical protein